MNTSPGAIVLHDKKFVPHIPESVILKAIAEVAVQINRDYKDTSPLFLGVLNGCFMFAADLMKEINLDCEIAFVRLASYSGTSSTGQVKQLFGIDASVKGRHLIVVEDIVDSGHTLTYLLQQIKSFEPASLKIATMLFKPDAYKGNFPVDYVGLRTGNEFLVGYGLDYNGKGRQLRDIYILSE